MKEYIEREALFKRINTGMSTIEALQAIIDFPTADVRPVVLCRDCRWWAKEEKSLQGRCQLGGFYPTGEWFCANGERLCCGAQMKEATE